MTGSAAEGPPGPPPSSFCIRCGAALPGPVRWCFRCGASLSHVFAAEFALEVEEGTRADAAAGAFRHVPQEAFRRFRVATIVWGTLTVAFVLVALAADRGGDPWFPLVILGWFFGVLSFFVMLGYGIQDLLLAAPETLRSPEKAFGTYLKCIREKRWEYAWHLVASRGRTGVRLRPGVESLGTPRAVVDLDSPRALREFWKPLFHATHWMNRHSRVLEVSVAQDGPDRAVAGGTVRVTAYPIWVPFGFLLGCFGLALAIVLYAILRKAEDVPVDMPLIRIDGRWYLADAVPALPDYRV